MRAYGTSPSANLTCLISEFFVWFDRMWRHRRSLSSGCRQLHGSLDAWSMRRRSRLQRHDASDWWVYSASLGRACAERRYYCERQNWMLLFFIVRVGYMRSKSPRNKSPSNITQASLAFKGTLKLLAHLFFLSSHLSSLRAMHIFLISHFVYVRKSLSFRIQMEVTFLS